MQSCTKLWFFFVCCIVSHDIGMSKCGFCFMEHNTGISNLMKYNSRAIKKILLKMPSLLNTYESKR